jgi:hypothetical protein
MEQSITGVVVLAVIVLTCSIIAHSLQKQFWIAVGLASLASTALLQVIVIFRAGYLDAYFPLAIAITLVISALCATLVGLIFIVFRTLR